MQEHSRFVKIKDRVFTLGKRLDDAEALAASRLELLRWCKERIKTDLSSRGSFHKHHYEDLLDALTKELGDE